MYVPNDASQYVHCTLCTVEYNNIVTKNPMEAMFIHKLMYLSKNDNYYYWTQHRISIVLL